MILISQNSRANRKAERGQRQRLSIWQRDLFLERRTLRTLSPFRKPLGEPKATHERE
jgi:hypothetical protein